MRIIDFRWRRRILPEGEMRADAANRAGVRAADDDIYLAGGYEPPRLMVAGRVRRISTGSSASGRSDANSQYYW